MVPPLLPHTMLGSLASALGASEPALRLLLSIILGYPLALVHRYTLYNKSPTAQHLFFITTGLVIGYFNYGNGIVHSIICILTIHLLLLTIGGTLHCVIIAFSFFMAYLLIGYYYTATESYDITWSMPHCVLTLRLIALAFDMWDGKKKPEKVSADQQLTLLKRRPGLLEIAGQTYFFGGFIVGPQFSMRRYLDFVGGEFTGKVPGAYPNCVIPGFLKGIGGLLCLLAYQVTAAYYPDTYILTDEYKALPFYMQMLMLGVWGKVVLYKYVACWLLAEGTCVLTGLTYNGKDENGNDLWDGCANIKLANFEVSGTFGGQVKAFNTNTNLWVARYVFKRMKFLGNKLISQAVALFFLAVWHGLHSGYYLTFALEFVSIKMERDIEAIITRVPALQNFFNNPIVKPIVWVLLKIYVTVFMGYCLIAFALLKYPRWWEAYSVTYFSGHVLFCGWLVIAPFVFLIMKPHFVKKVE